jgi:hypothetical protein
MAEKLDIQLTAKDMYSGELARMENRFKISGKSLAAFGGVATAAAAAVGTMVMKTAEAGDMFQKMSLRTGFSVKSLSELKHAAELSGTSINDMEMGFRKLSKNMSDANDGSITQERAFKSLGIQVTDTNGNLRDSELVFNEIVVAMSKIKNETQRAALAQTIFGRSGANMLPLIKSGTTEIDNMRKRARELGITFDQETAGAAAKFNDNLLEMKRNATGAGYAIGNNLIPKVNAFFQFFKDLKKFDTFNEDIRATYQLQPRGFQPGSADSLSEMPSNTTAAPGSEGETNNFDHANDDWANYYRSRLEGHTQHQATMAERAAEDQATRQEMRQSWFQSEHAEIENHEQTKASIQINWSKMVEHQENERRKRQLKAEKQHNAMRLRFSVQTSSNITSALDSLNTLNEGRHRETFELLKVAKMSEAAINTYAGATQALGAFPPPYSFIAAGAVVAAGLANIAVIQKQQFGGGSSGGGGGGSVGAIGSQGPILDPGSDTPTAPPMDGDGRDAQQVSIHIHNPLSTENWDEVAENEIIPAISRAGDRNVTIDVKH